MNIPTFDEWFKEKYGESFEDRYVFPSAFTNDIHRAMWRHGAEYLSEIVRASCAAPRAAGSCSASSASNPGGR